ncbi:DUF6471 domain-containing protein [Burkholderia thailandensis]|uniref:DUF6471 domain-containing protein n=1 Tax=Burkholderia thailandensis TaxID=57975 RepID=UPI0022ABC829|nr:DUF6471 domain-containing protein [Burkholderia thailandensis]MCZ2900945.1 DUF6471 domain-containing protein [Burkholderia thailandensis]MDD1480975.1 hypothetical protein [Burkholderia thailandensis]MDD1489132.1 hypothetical protein [Burkholderia thailandensis]MDD1493914.1 hypothetical protein [Burkholderia thailandensis]
MQPDTQWTRLASRVIKVALARKDLSYAELASALSASGVSETEGSLLSKLFRGSPKLSLLLQIIEISGAQPPTQWSSAMELEGSWQSRAAAVLATEFATQPWVTPAELVRRLQSIGVSVSERTLVAHLTEGTASLALTLQCLATLGSRSLERYIDTEDLVAAAKASAGL